MESDPWPKTIMQPFDMLPSRALPTDYFGPYNKLLYHLFPADTNFLVSPGVYPPRPAAAEPAVEFTVFYNEMPVLLLQIKAPETLRWPSAREQADIENRQRLRDLIPLCALPKLYAVSAFGTKLRFYAAVAGEGIDPVASPSYAGSFTDTVPLNRWNSDVLEEEGANLLKQSVAEIIARIYLNDGAYP
ncbi:hypothetical protein B0H17DRAFT_951446 [Mycena rosella]|uniref:Uncharacterized protein n=1 Tax=Mycena rosella TaxID=1033263 RepID=A0AAD7G4J9_MYCRO|nr:hypothetical protein B0H17DRAFT_951446 [Mycena rosella]